ncbi:MAG: nucleotidyltransferase family protein [Hyphomicrobium zavarzinii]|uniref:nucleotidyltransferase family protein n=1 Tax=Hyphomicrobium zavarzinii TaxID=48292 RepID=UPI001A505E21|nr:nucleotidyltransferase family protein [Hyphomicrobium zavarzinii]MBL8847493.1 nucleotidyltransferase family protein [Hyphomicrobium zavarzinii]
METSREIRVGAVLLAGGASLRFGGDNKLLARVYTAPLIATVARAVINGGVDTVVVVTGAEEDAYTSALSGLPVRFVHNGRWADGMGGSIAAGIRELEDACDGVFIVPGDMPNLTSDVFLLLASVFREKGGTRVVVPVTSKGAQRNPVLWPERQFSKLAALSGPGGGKSLLDTLGDERLDVVFDDESLFVDIDTADDYARFIGARR